LTRLRKPLAAFGVALGLTVVQAVFPLGGSDAAAPAYISILISRMPGQDSDAACHPYPGTVPTLTFAQALKARGVATVVGSIVLDRTDTADAGQCVAHIDSAGKMWGWSTGAGWNEIANLRDNFGWKFVSHSKSYYDLMEAPDDSVRQEETCGTLPILAARGHTDAWGLFNYPDNRIDAASDAIVTQCFAYSRQYNYQPVNTQASTGTYPHRLNVRSVNGGACHNPKLACYRRPAGGTWYVPPSQVIALLHPTEGNYAVAQFYKFVTGKRAKTSNPANPHWDCTSTNLNNHYTSQAEIYCYNDFLRIVNGRSTTAIVTHPAAVAAAWGRTPVSTTTTTPETTTTTPETTTSTSTSTSTPETTTSTIETTTTIAD
ncbi:MAG: hypothetical protein QOI61_1790, partial [Actinomycetota bacterium]